VKSARRAVAGQFWHGAVFYDGLEALAETVVTFVRRGLANDEPVLVAELPAQTDAIRAGLGEDAERVTFVDMADVGRNPACIIPVWLEFVSRHSGTPVRGVGEPAWAGRRAVELEECQLHEALLNVAFDDVGPFELLCPYDARRLPVDAVRGAMRTHPALVDKERAATYGGHAHAVDGFSRDLTPAPADAYALGFAAHDLVTLRSTVRWLGEEAQLSEDALEDLVLAVHELASNSVEHAGGTGVFRGWSGPESLVVEVSDRGVIDDPLIGREQVLDLSEDGRGIWMANHLCDLVQVRSSERGTTVRLHTWRQP
jgi:anti-sigma regulatory factor (Ser/Thr protein kinase)